MTYLSTNVMNDMDRVFSRFFTDTNTNRGFATDIAETPEGYRIEADLPGFTPEDVEVRIEDNVLVIEAGAADGKDSPAADDENRTWFIRERIEGSRRRSFALPEDADTGTLHAELKNGRLRVDFEKRPETRPLTFKVHG